MTAHLRVVRPPSALANELNRVGRIYAEGVQHGRETATVGDLVLARQRRLFEQARALLKRSRQLLIEFRELAARARGVR